VLQLLPGLYVVALALLAACGVRRWYEPLPWRVVVAFLVLVSAILAPVLFGGMVLLPLDILRGYPPWADLPAPEVHGNYLQRDLLTLILPQQAAVREAFATGHWPLINDRLGGGVPLLGDPQSQALQPLALLVLPLSLYAAPGALAALRILLALLGTWLFLRRLRVGEAAAFAGALAWGLGGFVMLWLGWPLANAAAWLPVALWATARCVDERRRRDVLLATVAIAGLLLAGQPEVVLYGMGLVTAFATVRVRARVLGLRGRRGASLGATDDTGDTGAAAGDGAERAGGAGDGSDAGSPPRAPGATTVRAMAPWALALVLALLLAAPALLPGAAAARQSERGASLLMNAFPYVPAAEQRALSLVRSRWLPIAAPNAFGNDRYLAYWGAWNVNEDASGFVGSVTLLLALAGLLARRGTRLPGERLLQGALAVALLGMVVPPALRGVLDSLPLFLRSPSYHHRLLLVAGFALACLAACELERLAAGRARRLPLVVAGLVLAGIVAWGYLGHPHPEAPATLAVLRDGWLRWHLRLLAVGVVALPLLRGRARAAPLAAACLIGFELLLAHLPANPPASPALAVPPSAVLTALRDAAAPSLAVVTLDDAMPANVASLVGLREVAAENPMQYGPCARALSALRSARGWDSTHFGLPLRLRASGTAAILAPAAEQALLGTERWRASYEERGVRVLEGPESPAPVRPPACVTEARWRRTAERVSVEVLATTPVSDSRPHGGGSPPPGECRSGDPCADLMILGLCNDGGARALVDGRPHPPTDAAEPFVALDLPRGARTVEVLQRPRGFLAGLLAAAVGMALALTLLAPPPRRENHEEPAARSLLRV
jgi:hypothetical protein